MQSIGLEEIPLHIKTKIQEYSVNSEINESIHPQEYVLKSSTWIFFPFLILMIAIVLLYPNFAVRQLELVIHPDYKSLSQDESEKILKNFIHTWETDYNSDGKYTITPDPEKGIPENNKFTVTGRFITSAKINQISQENIKLFFETKNILIPTDVENLLKKGK